MTPRRYVVVLAALALPIACSPSPDVMVEEPEAPAIAVTSWTEVSELFAEYPPLVAGEHAIFAVHLTDLRDFSALEAGRARVELTPTSGGTPAVLEGGPSRPGVFRSEGTVPAPGEYRMVLLVDAPGLTDRHDLGTVRVFEDEVTAWADAEAEAEDDASAITYLKEQQWVNPFATRIVHQAELRQAIRVPAEIGPITGGEALVSAPAAGRFTADALLSIGDRVQRDQVVGQLDPRLAASGTDRATLAAAVAETDAEVEAAQVELSRSQRLLDERAVPARRVEEAARALRVAEVRRQAAEARLSQRDETLRTGGGVAAGNAFVLRAPIAGRIADVYAALGASYDEGAPLLRIVRTDEVELRAMIPASDVSLVRGVREMTLEVPGRPDPIPLRFDHMHDPGELDPEMRALPVQFHVENRSGALLLGQTGTVNLYTDGTRPTLVVPEEAVLTEAGRPFVYLHAAGESFVRRFIETGPRDRGLVAVISGLAAGDRVVTDGAYEIHLAAASNSLPAEGHVH